jgi:hypothetical protein
MGDKLKAVYKKVTVEAGDGGWILREQGKPAEVYVRWDKVVRRLEYLLTSKGDGEVQP